MPTAFGLWANELSFMSGFILLVGSIVGVAGMFENWQFSAACIPVSVLVLVIEYPRSKVKRKYQSRLARALMYLGPLTKFYWPRMVLYILISVPSFFLVPTIIGGISLVISAVIYCVAHAKGETWEPLSKKPSCAKPNWIESPKTPDIPPPRTIEVY